MSLNQIELGQFRIGVRDARNGSVRFDARVVTEIRKVWCEARVFIPECLLGRRVLALSASLACAGTVC